MSEDATKAPQDAGPDEGKAASGKDAAKGEGPPKVAGKAGLPPVVILAATVVAALAAGGALGALLVAPRVNTMRHVAALKAAMGPGETGGTKQEKSKHEKKGENGKSSVYKIENIIVNPSGSQGQRFLMCSVAIEADDSKLLDVLRDHEIEVRDRVITHLSRQTLDRLTADNSRDSLRDEIRASVLPVLGHEAKPADLKVYLPQFVVQ
jgi:flagellar basal body-associated protein FliL